MQSQIENFHNFANKFADQSRSILNEKFRGSFTFQSKKDGSFVTEIDKTIEDLFRKNVKKEFPYHGVIGEEFKDYQPNSKFIWVIDPLDGTHSFMSGKPLFGTLISLNINKKPILGLIDIPILRERWSGGENLGVYYNGKKCSYFETNNSLSDSIVSSTSLLMFNKSEEKRLKKIYKNSKFPIFGTDCYAYGLLISKKIDLIIENNMKPWDFLAQVPLINELGGVISDWSGKKLNVNSNGQVIACSSLRAYEQAMVILSETKD